MSGGSWDYFYNQLDEVGKRLARRRHVQHRAFGKHLIKCAAAMKAIEWVDSGDSDHPEDYDAIESVLGSERIMKSMVEDAEETIKELRELTTKIKAEEWGKI